VDTENNDTGRKGMPFVHKSRITICQASLTCSCKLVEARSQLNLPYRTKTREAEMVFKKLKKQTHFLKAHGDGKGECRI